MLGAAVVHVARANAVDVAVFLGTAPDRAPSLYHLMSFLDLADGVRTREVCRRKGLVAGPFGQGLGHRLGVSEQVAERLVAGVQAA